MKIYVDEMPKGCENCPFYIEEHCVISTLSLLCPLEENKIKLNNIAEHDKQLRNELIDEIKDLAGDCFELPYCDNCGHTDNNDVVLTGNDLTEILDYLRGENDE